MTWILFSLLSCLALVAGIELTRKNRLDGFEVTFYRSLISVLFLFPFFAVMAWPTHVPYYLMIIGSGLIITYGSIVMSNLAVRHSGRVAMMYQPIVIFLTFLLWIALVPSQREALFSSPIAFYGTLACFSVLIVSLHFIRANDYAWRSFMIVLPVAVCYALMNVAQKFFLDAATSDWHLILNMILLGNLSMVVTLPAFSRFRVGTPELSITHMADFPFWPLMAISGCNILSWGGLLYAIGVAPNPAYPVAVLALAPVIFTLYYWVRGWRDNASPLAATIMTLSSFCLAIVNS